MAWVTALIGALGAAGSAVVSNRHRGNGRTIRRDDPLANQQLIEALTGLGIPVPQDVLLRASPLSQVRGLSARGTAEVRKIIESGQAQGLDVDQITELVSQYHAKTYKHGDQEGEFKRRNDGSIRSPLSKLGGKHSPYASLRDLVEAEIGYTGNAIAGAGDLRRIQEETLAGRRSAQSALARVMGGFVAPSEADINTRSSEIEGILRAQIARDFGDREKNALYQANAYGINPAGQLGRLGEGRALAELGAGPDALARTLQLLGGEQTLQANAINGLTGALNFGTNNANAQVGRESQQAAQVLALAQMQSNNLAAGIQGVTGQLATIPGLLQEQARQNRLDSSLGNINRQIDPLYGISRAAFPERNLVSDPLASVSQLPGYR